MNALWLNLQQTRTILVHGQSSGGFQYKGHGSSLVEQLQVAFRVLHIIPRITKDAAVQEGPVNISHLYSMESMKK